MKLAELEAINHQVTEVQAIPTDYDTVEPADKTVEEAQKEAANTKATRPKKKKAGVRSN